MSNTTPSCLVIRGPVPDGLTALKYRPYLRRDFWYACAYCTITEVEATGVGFQVEHFRPKLTFPHLAREYDNLMWSCSTCNRSKWDVWPDAREVARGYRFLRPDEDDFRDHLKLPAGDVRLSWTTPAGRYTTEVIRLNRSTLLRVRGLRRQFSHSSDLVAEGMRALRRVKKLDLIPPKLRFRASAIRDKLEELNELRCSVEDTIRHLVAEDSSSHVLDEENAVDRRQKRERRRFLKELGAIGV